MMDDLTDAERDAFDRAYKDAIEAQAADELSREWADTRPLLLTDEEYDKMITEATAADLARRLRGAREVC